MLLFKRDSFAKLMCRAGLGMSVRRKLKGKKPPEGWELIEDVIEDFE